MLAERRTPFDGNEHNDQETPGARQNRGAHDQRQTASQGQVTRSHTSEAPATAPPLAALANTLADAYARSAELHFLCGHPGIKPDPSLLGFIRVQVRDAMLETARLVIAQLLRKGRDWVVNDTNRDFILCLRCGLVSWHPEDVAHRYCGRCHIFHEGAGA